ncbi:MAG: hypothetical protein DCC71_20460 [Proteobacteria bacterium]|nr:MAG: hypothetical protein DCC71_20460 [Pseudomonadota bacterium]
MVIGACAAIAALLPRVAAADGIVLGDALSRIDTMCMSTQGPMGDFPEDGFWSCEEHPATPSESGTTRATASASFGDLLLTAVSTDCVSCPFAPSTRSASRISFELAVATSGSPPQPLQDVPVRITTEGEVGVAPLGLLAAGGTYLSSTLQTTFTNADVFAHTMKTVSPTVLADDYAITETVDLFPDEVYFGNVYVGCNQNSSIPGDWACSGHASVQFALDQAAFDARMGAQSFDLSQFFAIQRSPNLVPEPSSALLDSCALGLLVLSQRARRWRRSARAMLRA